MLELDRSHIAAVHQASTPRELCAFVQRAIELEHAAIPPYLTALRSIDRASNPAAWQVLHSIVVEEMLHMCIGGNLLLALGGVPSINRPDFVPTYPGTLPLGVGDGLVVSLAPLSPSLVHDTFMRIEEPGHDVDSHALVADEALDVEATIGHLYHAIGERLRAFGDAAFVGDAARQVLAPKDFPRDELFPITGVATALEALEVIVSQGEGSAISPYEAGRELAHYYRLGELHHGRRLVPDPAQTHGFAFGGDAVPVDWSAVRPLNVDQRFEDLAHGGAPHRQALTFASEYSRLLDALHDAFATSGELQPSIDQMFVLKAVGEDLVAMDDPATGGKVGPVYAYLAEPARVPAHA